MASSSARSLFSGSHLTGDGGLAVSDRAAFQAVLKEFEDRTGGRLDLLFNNAGIIKSGLFGRMGFADIERIIQVNLMGVLYGIHAAYPLLERTPNSLCFTTSSSSAIFGATGLAAYTASKHAVKGLTESLSVEFSIIDSRAADAHFSRLATYCAGGRPPSEECSRSANAVPRNARVVDLLMAGFRTP